MKEFVFSSIKRLNLDHIIPENNNNNYCKEDFNNYYIKFNCALRRFTVFSNLQFNISLLYPSYNYVSESLEHYNMRIKYSKENKIIPYGTLYCYNLKNVNFYINNKINNLFSVLKNSEYA